jgi:hypothetical protein
MSSRANWSGEVSSRERDALSIGSSSIPARGHSVGSRRIIASTKQPSRTIRATWFFTRRALRHLQRGLRLRTDVVFASLASFSPVRQTAADQHTLATADQGQQLTRALQQPAMHSITSSSRNMKSLFRRSPIVRAILRFTAC